MTKIIVNTQAEAIKVARILTRAANCVPFGKDFNDIEQITLINNLCQLCESIEVRCEESDQDESK